MSITEAQLETWSNLGAQQLAEATYNSLGAALNSYRWPSGIEYDVYLQGSYRNKTNTRGNSDVDLVVELTKFSAGPIFYSNLSEVERATLNITTVDYGWRQFRATVIEALTLYYGAQFIDTSGNKSIKVLPNGNRLKADVVVAMTYRNYGSLKLNAEGIVLWTIREGQQIINYPKLHWKNGSDKNSEYRTNGWFKPVVRVFKNARNRIVEIDQSFASSFPSYFVESLLYNVPDTKFGESYQQTYIECLQWIANEFSNGHADRFICQNGLVPLFGDSIVQWQLSDAVKFLSRLISLWERT